MNQYLFRFFRNNEIKVHELSYLFWECTTRCNFHCRHCGTDCGIASRDWARTGRCEKCAQWRNCLGGGMHNRHGSSGELLQCHWAKTL
jgi:hypothetical protein